MVATVTRSETSTPNTRSPQADGAEHQVQHGDTLSGIASSAGVSLRALLSANPQIANPDRIYPGDRIALPAADAAAPPAAATASTTGTGATQLSDAGVDLIKGFEGLRLSAYQDSADVWTIGYGHTAGVQPGDRISTAEAERLLRQDTAWAQDAVRSLVKVPLSQNQFDALTSFTFNLGAEALEQSTLLRKLNAGDMAGAQAEFGRWVHADGEVLPGLVRRRAAEGELFREDGLVDDVIDGVTNKVRPMPEPEASQTAADITVRRGDTLWDIANEIGLPLGTLLDANPQIGNPHLIQPGQTLHRP